MWVTECNKAPVITIFIGAILTNPSHGWFMTLFYPHDVKYGEMFVYK
jgi:hypothetical protein